MSEPRGLRSIRLTSFQNFLVGHNHKMHSVVQSQPGRKAMYEKDVFYIAITLAERFSEY
jgi:hypothetical protein